MKSRIYILSLILISFVIQEGYCSSKKTKPTNKIETNSNLIIEKLYDYKGKVCEPNEARFYSLTVKTDSGYCQRNYFIKEHALEMIGNYEDSLCKIRNGSFRFYYPDKTLKLTGKYIHGKKDGLWLHYHNNKVMSDSTVYAQGKQVGTSLSWFPNGYPQDSIYTNEDGSGNQVSWFDNGILSARGRFSKGKKQNGKWFYYHMNGKMSSIEIYHDSLLTSKQYFDENGNLMNDTTNTARIAQYPGGIEVWKKYISNKLYFPPGYKIVNSDIATLVVTFTVDENGVIENVFTRVPFDIAFDRIAENVIRKSPKWIPAINHNRKVKCSFSLPVSFQNYVE